MDNKIRFLKLKYRVYIYTYPSMDKKEWSEDDNCDIIIEAKEYNKHDPQS